MAATTATTDALRPDPKVSAKEAGLRYVNDDMPGIRRVRRGRGFSYIGPDGETIRDADERARLEALAIPPAWDEVWISPWPNGHLQATGRDEKGRKQYRYHERWHEVRNETKFNRMIAFGEALPAIRQRVEEDLKLRGLPRSKVLATVLRLLETTLFRVGNREYARNNQHYGLTTLRDKHVTVEGSTVHFQFTGKSGKTQSVDVQDRRLARIVKQCRDIPGHELFQYLDDAGQRQTVGSGDVNDYLREITGQDFTAKDFRTWGGTVLAAATLLECAACESEAEAQRNVVQAIKVVAEQLGNTPAVCRRWYVHPGVLECYVSGSMAEMMARARRDEVEGLHPEEATVMHLLHCMAEPADEGAG